MRVLGRPRSVLVRIADPVRRVGRRIRFRLRHGGHRSTFDRIHRDNYWAHPESVSGPGSAVEQTQKLVEDLPPLLRSLEVGSLLDIPCGDFAWMRRVDLDGIDYLGCDIVEGIIDENRRQHGADGVRFEVKDLTADALPTVDVVLVRDCLVHLPNRLIWKALANLKRSGSTWLLATTHPGVTNQNVSMGRWRPLDLTAPPFWFGEPTAVIVEGCTERGGVWRDKSLGLWRIHDLPTRSWSR